VPFRNTGNKVRYSHSYETAGQEGHQDAHAQTVGVAAHDIAEDGAHRHDAFHAQV